MESGSTKKDKSSKQSRLLSRLRVKYRLVILDEQSFAERFSLRLSPMNLFIWFGTISLLLIVLTTILIALTPLREYIPGYPDGSERKQIIENAQRVDSLENEMRMQNEYMKNVLTILSGNKPNDSIAVSIDSSGYSDTQAERALEDSLLRLKVESEEKYDLQFSRNVTLVSNDNMYGIFFFTPLEGNITQSFNISKGHYGIDIASSQKDAVKATLDGTVIFSGWTSDGGNEVHIQHGNNLISVYKHNSVLLKKTGDTVKAGDPVAIVGNTGEMSEGEHLHFELWHKGKAIDPQNYLIL